VLHLSSGSGSGGHRRLAAALRPGTVRDGYGKASKEVPAFALSIANNLWGQEGLSIKSGFLRTLRESYGAPLERIDFLKTGKARERINAWVAENTRDRILNIVPEGLPTPDTLLALANAIYFKAAWTDPFEEMWTEEAPFLAAEGRSVPAKMMYRVGGYRYASHRGMRALEIDYRGGETSMVILLPKERGGLAAVEEKLDGKYLEGVLGGLEHEQVSVKLPRFEVTFPVALTDTLPEMGMRDAFVSSKADFTGITEQEPLFIGAVLHKAFVAVDEAGTEAAAATVVMMIKGGPPPGEPVEFVADHPFLFLIRHRKTGTILFLGRVTNPKPASS
jgi:serpin B